jgi:hypothetical protein
VKPGCLDAGDALELVFGRCLNVIPWALWIISERLTCALFFLIAVLKVHIYTNKLHAFALSLNKIKGNLSS